jgi:glycosyltransferase involved in cell wall biosynthesis
MLTALILRLTDDDILMKISVLFGDYCPFHESKDPGQIPLGLMDSGVETDLITITKPVLKDYKPSFSVIQKSKEELLSDNFWNSLNSDVVIVYYLWLRYPSMLLKKIKLSGKKIILKLDNDGRIAYPLQRHDHRVPLRERLSITNLVSEAFWLISPESIKRRKHKAYAEEFIRQVALSTAVIIESPAALANLNYFLDAWDRSDLAQKIVFIPNPVTPDFLEGQVGEKENLAIAHGRWDDYQVKNTAVMVTSAVEFLKQRPDWRFNVFGHGTELVKKYLEPAPPEVKRRFAVSEFVPHEEVKGKLASAKLLFIPSRWESFSLAAAEAVCSGCSVVGTPAEALQYLSNGGASGTIAADFKRKAISAALVEDAAKWDRGSYDPEKIAAYWRPKLDRKAIAKSILDLAADKNA